MSLKECAQIFHLPAVVGIERADEAIARRSGLYGILLAGWYFHTHELWIGRGVSLNLLTVDLERPFEL